MTPTLSIIIPVHSEETRLPCAMTRLGIFKRCTLPETDVLFVENGSTDGTADMLSWYAERNDWIRVASLADRGKGGAVRFGVQHARGKYIYMADVDFSTPLREVPRFLRALEGGADVVIGSREIDRRLVRTSWNRRLIGRVFHQVVKGIVPGIQDTQCGFKAFDARAARFLFHQLKLTGLAFDVELLYMAQMLGFTIRELPVEWRENSDSRVKLGSDSLQMLVDVLSIPKLHAGEGIIMA
jgi:glycosyltransferase involved in cell wall biosynthesis